MKFVLLFFFVAVSYACPSPCDWETFKDYYERTYTNPVEEMFRKGIFERNKKMVDEHNSNYQLDLVSYMVNLNQYSDMTEEELKFIRGDWPD